MGIYDRNYTQENFQPRYHYASRMRFGMQPLTPVVKWLLIINVAVYFMQILGADKFLITWFSVFPVSLGVALQFWRFVTYQFLHGGLWHILFNMMGLFFLGPLLERQFGSKRFLTFYLTCGVVGGFCYPLLVAVKFLSVGPMIGASAAIFGILAACAILFPQITVLLFFFIPVSIRVASIIVLFITTVTILTKGNNAGGEAAHLGGMAAGAIYVFWPIIKAKFNLKTAPSSREKKMVQQQNLQIELDRILQKVHDSGIHSLTTKEKRTLKKATKLQQMQNNNL